MDSDKLKPDVKKDKEHNRDWQNVDGVDFPKPAKILVRHMRENDDGTYITTTGELPVFIIKRNIDRKKMPVKKGD